MTFVALLRGINVGKAKRIAMADLRALLEGLGHVDVKTLLNSGNVVFTAASGTPAALAKAIEKAIHAELGIEVPVVVLRARDFQAAIEANPLPMDGVDPSRFLVAFVQEPSTLAPAKPLAAQAWGDEALALGKQVAYIACPGGVLDSKAGKAFERATKGAATARNWATVLKLQAMLGDG